MKRRGFLVFVLVTCLTVFGATSVDSVCAGDSSDCWETKTPMNQARSGLGVAVVDGKIYAIGGVTSNGFTPSSPGSAVYCGTTPATVTGANEEYDPETDTWKDKTPMPTARAVFAIAVYHNKIYCIGGKTHDNYTAVTEVYDPATDTWETKTPTPTARGWLGAQAVGNKIHVMGGYPDGTINEVYDPETDSWTDKTPPPIPVTFWCGRASSAVFSNKIYCFGGFSQETQHCTLNQIYDTETDSWSLGASLPSNTSAGAAAVTTDVVGPERIYNIGLTQVGIYDPVKDSWRWGAEVLTVRYDFGVAVVDDVFYVIGGHKHNWIPGNYTVLAVNEQYTPFRYEDIPPLVTVVSPQNSTYNITDVSLVFTVDEQTTWMGYSLDGQAKVTLNGNVTLTQLPEGAHNITVYAEDTDENMGNSQTVHFTVTKPQKPPPQTKQSVPPEITAIMVTGTVTIVAAIVIVKKIRKNKT